MNSSLERAHDLTIERQLDVSPEACFALWTDPATMTRWWGPKDDSGEPFQSMIESWDAIPGATWSIIMTAPDGTQYVQGGEMIEVDAPRLLRFSFHWVEDGRRGPPTDISVRFTPQGAGTLLTFTQKGFSDAETRDSHEQGWKECLDRFGDEADTLSDPSK